MQLLPERPSCLPRLWGLGTGPAKPPAGKGPDPWASLLTVEGRRHAAQSQMLSLHMAGADGDPPRACEGESDWLVPPGVEKGFITFPGACPPWPSLSPSPSPWSSG